MNGPHVLVIGDCWCEYTVTGHVDRLSPEAPVPILLCDRSKHTRFSLGGAALVARNLFCLGCRVTLCGSSGSDPIGERLREHLRFTQDTILATRSAATGVVSRFYAGNHLLLEVDEFGRLQADWPLPPGGFEPFDAIVLYDRGLGTLAVERLGAFQGMGELNKPLIVDAPVELLGKYQAVHPWIVRTTADVVTVSSRAFIVNPSPTEIRASFNGGDFQKFDVPPLPFSDSVSSGEAFLAALIHAGLESRDMQRALLAAAKAGRHAASQSGPLVLTRAEYNKAWQQIPALRDKLLDLEELTHCRSRLPDGAGLVLTSGAFNPIYPQDIAFLERARQLGDALVVALEGDLNLRAANHQVIVDENARSHVLAAMAAVDFVVILPAGIAVDGAAARVRPDILVDPVLRPDAATPGAGVVLEHGGVVQHLLPTDCGGP
jgi:D-beta-D-heptose 7-phosphate kinase/D-beta-D-heptose 1-phosphate adenosyltransferase